MAGTTDNPGQVRFRFGQFEFDSESGRLTRNGLPVKLQTQPARVLTILLEAGGEVVTREQLQRELWPGESYGNFDTGLNTAIRKLRDALDDLPGNPRFVETLPRLGYRFLAPIERIGAERAVVEPGRENETRIPEVAPPESSAPLVREEQAAAARSERIRWAVAGLTLGVVLIALIGFIGPRVWTDAPTEALRLSLSLPPGHEVVLSPRGPKLAVAPDGGAVYYVARVDGVSHVYRRSLTKPSAEQMPGTEATQSIAISPDGRRLALHRNNRVWSVDLRTLSMTPVTPKDWLPAPVQSFAWDFDGRLYLASAAVQRAAGKQNPGWASGGMDDALLARQRIYRSSTDLRSWELLGKAVSASPSRGDEFQFPNQVTGDGRLVMSTVWGPFDRSLYARDLATGADSLLIQPGVAGFLTQDRELLYSWRGDLLGRRMDGSWPKERASATLASGLPDAGWGAAHFAVSHQGTLVYLERPAMEVFELVWVDKQGKETPVPVAGGAYYPLDLSSDGEFLLLGMLERSGLTTVWQLSLRTGEWKRMMGAAPDPAGGVWSPDGRMALIPSFRGELRFPNLFAVARDGTGAVQRVLPSELGQYPASWPSAQAPMAYARSGVRESGTDIGLLRFAAAEPATPGTDVPFRVKEDRVLRLPGDQTTPVVSPDGRWVAYIQDDAGDRSLRVCALPECSVQAGVGFGNREQAPVWDGDSTTLYFRSGGDVWETRVEERGSDFRLAVPRRLFEDRYAPSGFWTRQMLFHAPSRRFLFARSLKPAEPIRQIQVVLHWPKLLDSAPPAISGRGIPAP
jgi:DNA-binding winged helix-turn-helix (wHTH) protein